MRSFEHDVEQLGVRLADAQVRAFDRYVELLQDWSRRANLVGDASEDVVRRRHFLESIALGVALRQREVLRPESRVIDVGAGAGFPGLPMKIVWPQIQLTLLESTAKKTAFLSATVDALGLDDVRIVTARAEEAAHEASLRAQFDLVLARGVAPVRTLVELTLPFARTGGRVVAPKGSRTDVEVSEAKRALEILGGRVLVVPLDVPGPPQKLVVMVKDRETPPEYPRRAGVPKRRPL